MYRSTVMDNLIIDKVKYLTRYFTHTHTHTKRISNELMKDLQIENRLRHKCASICMAKMEDG